MPSILSHSLFTACLTPLRPQKKDILKTLLLSMICASIPDLDVIGFSFGVQYNDMLGHRGWTHSISFALLWSLLIVLIFYKQQWKNKFTFYYWIYFYFLCTISHGIFDAMTDGGKGVGFFIPFINERYFFYFRPIPVFPLGLHNIFSEWGWRVFRQELFFFIPLSLSTLFLTSLWRYKFIDKITE
ncbi:MAG: metal-dependent hydrolase [Bacteroidota bacterium]|nr:metal-dependent hydrolase [Bacteroidota bacterium]